MKVDELIKRRRPDWDELAADTAWAANRKQRRQDPERLARFARRYRAVCSDLAVSRSLSFPTEAVDHLHQLIADAHGQLYRAESFRLRDWGTTLFREVPRRILHDPCTWIAMATFWGLFFGSLCGAIVLPEFAVQMLGEQTLNSTESMYAAPISQGRDESSGTLMTGFYVFNNAGIGLRCFAAGLFFGVGSLLVLAFNALFLGTLFGHMLVAPMAGNFLEFVTAHGPFELTAVVLAAAAGLRMGWSMIDTNGLARFESLRRGSGRSLETAMTATILFILAAFIEGNVSPSTLPYAGKALFALVSTLILTGYVFWLGRGTTARSSDEAQ